MSFMKNLIREYIVHGAIVLLVIFGGLFYKKYTSIPQDNIIEESVEEVIFVVFNEDVDLSPETLEEESHENSSRWQRFIQLVRDTKESFAKRNSSGKA